MDLIFGDPLPSPLILAGGHGDRDLILWLDGLLKRRKKEEKILGKPGNIGFLDHSGRFEHGFSHVVQRGEGEIEPGNHGFYHHDPSSYGKNLEKGGSDTMDFAVPFFLGQHKFWEKCKATVWGIKCATNQTNEF